ncbi:unnamed protein product [Linum tenue]|uniref:Uncharacterized protein n=1 Tax=Linum tenue TaxID=586396 RepID=A0AAV0NPN1_9ROSI|nr:unnamed protein product [Linum tenue]
MERRMRDRHPIQRLQLQQQAHRGSCFYPGPRREKHDHHDELPARRGRPRDPHRQHRRGQLRRRRGGVVLRLRSGDGQGSGSQGPRGHVQGGQRLLHLRLHRGYRLGTPRRRGRPVAVAGVRRLRLVRRRRRAGHLRGRG